MVVLLDLAASSNQKGCGGFDLCFDVTTPTKLLKQYKDMKTIKIWM